MRIVLGVGGGIAAYKSAELLRTLQRHGHDVQVVLTRSAQRFITPLTFAALSGRKVITHLFAPESNADETLSSAVEHIAVAQEHDLLVVAPATANLLARFAHGFANDFLTTLYLAFRGPVVLAPAMNTNMWTHPATEANLDVLRGRGHIVIAPDEGLLACGTVGSGRLPDPEQIAAVINTLANPRTDLAGEVVLITAGPTREAVDPVRYLTNRSSGKMGYALAAAALRRGARVILVSGPVQIAPPANVEVVSVESAREMRDAVMARLGEASIVIKAAAVADFHVRDVPVHKIKKTAARLTLELEPTPDILAEVGANKGERILIGFAAETDNLVDEARRKLATKKCDMVVANTVGKEGSGFEADSNEVVLVSRFEDPVHFGPAPKTQVADRILDAVPQLRLAIHATT